MLATDHLGIPRILPGWLTKILANRIGRQRRRELLTQQMGGPAETNSVLFEALLWRRRFLLMSAGAEFELLNSESRRRNFSRTHTNSYGKWTESGPAQRKAIRAFMAVTLGGASRQPFGTTTIPQILKKLEDHTGCEEGSIRGAIADGIELGVIREVDTPGRTKTYTWTSEGYEEAWDVYSAKLPLDEYRLFITSHNAFYADLDADLQLKQAEENGTVLKHPSSLIRELSNNPSVLDDLSEDQVVPFPEKIGQKMSSS